MAKAKRIGPEQFRLQEELRKGVEKALIEENRSKPNLYNTAIKEYLEKRGYITSKKK